MICNLPTDIINKIKEYIPAHDFVFVNKTFYCLYHRTIRNYIPLYDSYVRDMIRKDNFFVFEKIIGENFDNWYKINKYHYKNMVFSNYLQFVMAYSIENNSSNCREIIIDYLSKRNLYKNLHKKNVVKYIKWNNLN